MARPKKAQHDKLDCQLPETRCTGSDLVMLKEKAAQAGISRGEYLRRLIRNAEIVVRQSHADVALVREVNRIGVNLWQALREYRANGGAEPEALASAIAKVDRILDPVLEDMLDGSTRR
jgi:hypothetical protein